MGGTTGLGVSWIVDSSQDEQREVLESRGVPDMVWRRGWNLERWVYCECPTRPLVIEFGRNGRTRNEWWSNNEDYCSDAAMISIDD